MMAGMTAGMTAGRGWAGTTLDARRAERRRKLLDAGLELLGTGGVAALTVRSVCRQAGLTDRYFYENFADRSELMLAVFDEVAAEAATALLAAAASGRDGERDDAAVARAAVDAFLSLIADDPRKGRVLLLAPLTDQTLGAHGVAAAPAFAQIVQRRLDATSPDAALIGTAVVGALTNLFIRWLDGSQPVDRDHLADFCVRLLLNASALAT